MTRPVRVQLSRAKGFDLQEHSRAVNGLGAISVARPGPLGNPFKVGRDGTREECAHWHALALNGLICIRPWASIDDLKAIRPTFDASWQSLRGYNLACWCRLDGKPCHADNLLEAVATMEKRNG